MKLVWIVVISIICTVIFVTELMCVRSQPFRPLKKNSIRVSSEWQVRGIIEGDRCSSCILDLGKKTVVVSPEDYIGNVRVKTIASSFVVLEDQGREIVLSLLGKRKL